MGTAFPIAASSDRYCGTLILGPGDGFNFHYHSRQDEVVYVIEGKMDAWVGQDCSVIGPGDMMLAPAGIVHADFNVSQQPVKLLNVLSPLIPDVPEEWRMTDSWLGDGRRRWRAAVGWSSQDLSASLKSRLSAPGDDLYSGSLGRLPQAVMRSLSALVPDPGLIAISWRVLCDGYKAGASISLWTKARTMDGKPPPEAQHSDEFGGLMEALVPSACRCRWVPDPRPAQRLKFGDSYRA